MMYIGIDLTQMKDSFGKIRYVHPKVEMSIDVEDNFDTERLKEFKRGLEEYLEGLNDCLTDENGTDDDTSGLIH